MSLLLRWELNPHEVRQKRSVLGMFMKLRRAAGAQGPRSLGLESDHDCLSSPRMCERGNRWEVSSFPHAFPNSRERGLHWPPASATSSSGSWHTSPRGCIWLRHRGCPVPTSGQPGCRQGSRAHDWGLRGRGRILQRRRHHSQKGEVLGRPSPSCLCTRCLFILRSPPHPRPGLLPPKPWTLPHPVALLGGVEL